MSAWGEAAVKMTEVIESAKLSPRHVVFKKCGALYWNLYPSRTIFTVASWIIEA